MRQIRAHSLSSILTVRTHDGRAHGTARHYLAGCRCPFCRKANIAYRRGKCGENDYWPPRTHPHACASDHWPGKA